MNKLEQKASRKFMYLSHIVVLSVQEKKKVCKSSPSAARMSKHKQIRGFLTQNSFDRFFTLVFCLILSRLRCIFCEDSLKLGNTGIIRD